MATNDEIIAKLPLALVELRKQNRAGAKKAAEDRAKEFEVLMAQRDAQKTDTKEGKAARKTMNKTLNQMRNQDSRKEAREKEATASTAGQAITLKKELEEQGKTAEDNKGFQKLSFKARKEDRKQRLKNATSPAAKKDIRQEARADAKKNGSRLDKIGAGIGGLFEMGKKSLKAAALGGIALLSTLAIGGLLIALGEFLQSDTFKNMTKFISEVIIPKLMEFWDFIKENWEEIAIGIGSLLIAIGIVKAAVLAAKFVAIANKIVLGFIAVKTFLAGTMLPAITGFMVPLLPIIAIAALVALAICALWAAFESFQTTLEETGSVSEALKAAITTFISTLLGAIPALFLKLVSWVAGIFGFDEFAKKVDKIDPIKMIAETISGLVSDIVDFFTMLFDFDFTKYLKDMIPETVKKVFGMERGVSGMSEVDKAEEIKSLEDDIKGGNKRAAKYERDIATDLRARGPEHNKAGNARRLTKATAIRDKNEERLARIQELKGERPGTLSENRSGELAPVREGTAAEKAEFKAMKRRDQDGNVIKMEQYEKDRVKREAAGAGGGSGGPTNIVDARQSSNVTTTGQSGNSPIIFQKFGRLNMRSSEGV